MLTQAAGRAGRGEKPGRVLVQTFFPEHYAIRMAAEQNYEAFFHKEMRFRRMMHYPPLTALANVIAQGSKLEQAAVVAKHMGRFLIPLEKYHRRPENSWAPHPRRWRNWRDAIASNSCSSVPRAPA